MRLFGLLLVMAAAWLAVPGSPAFAQAQQVVEIPTRPGQNVRAIQLRPAGNATAAVILLAGGHGNLSIGRDGNIMWGKGIHLVRARADFAKAGLAVLLPDIAADHKKGEDAVPDYRASVAHAMDIGALVAHMRKSASPVVLVATDKAAVSAANAAVRLSGTQRPDAVVIASGMLIHVSSKQPSVERLVPGVQRISQPMLLIHHAKSTCRLSQPSHPTAFQSKFLSGASKVDFKTVDGGTPTAGDPCGPQTSHGYVGQDAEVVRTIADWVKALGKG